MRLKLSFKLKLKEPVPGQLNLVEDVVSIDFPDNFFNNENADNVGKYFDKLRENMKNEYKTIIFKYFDVEISKLD